jgi:hypothetical protein
MMNVWALIGLMVLSAQSGSAQVELSASTKSAYEGEIVDLQLTIHLPARSSPYSITIPWLETSSAAFEWVLPAEEWLCEHTVPRPGSLPLHWRKRTLYARMIRPSEFELHWQMRVIGQRENGEPIRLDAVQVESVKSQSIVIQVQPRSSSGISPSAWDLGAGSYQVKASWQKNDVTLGDEALLLLAVTGQGDLSNIFPPVLASQPGWERDAYLLELAPETWKDQGKARVFRYRVRPRRLGTQTPPGVTVQFFDPKSNHLQTVRIRIPVLNVISNVSAGIKLNGKTADLIRNLPPSWQQILAAKEREADGRLVFSRTAMALPVIFALCIIGRVLSIKLFGNALARLRWRSAARRAERQINSETARLDADWWKQLLAQFLTKGLQKKIPSDLESIRSAFAITGFSDKSEVVVQAVQELEFGPNEYHREEKVRSAAKEFFLEMWPQEEREIGGQGGKGKERRQVISPCLLVALSPCLFGAMPQKNDIPRQDAAATIAALQAYELHHGRDDWSWQLLRQVRPEVYDPLFAQKPMPAWLDGMYIFSLRWFLLLGLIIVSGGAWLAWQLWHQRSTWRALAWSVVWFLLLFSLYWMITPSNEQLAVVKTDATILRQGNGLSYPPHLYQGLPIRLAAGVEATVRAQRSNGWVQVLLPNEKIGWVPSDSVYFIK